MASATDATRAGQALVETLLASLAILLALFGLLQVALASGAREVLRHAAARAARAKSVGFNDWMAEKAVRVAAIPVSGRRTVPADDWLGEDGGGGAAGAAASRIPGYLGADNSARASWVLSYEEWERGWPVFSVGTSPLGEGALRASVRMDYPLRMPLAGFFVPFAEKDEDGTPRLPMSATAAAPDQSRLYLSGAR